MDFTKPEKEQKEPVDIVRNHSVDIYNEETKITVPAGSIVVVTDISKDQYPLSQSGKSLAITRSNGRFETIKDPGGLDTTLFYNFSVSARLPK